MTKTAEECAALLHVSRETFQRLQLYVTLLAQWQKRLNLIAEETVGDIWERHILDSGQILALLPALPQKIIDMGSGAGLPGMVLAIMGVPEVVLVESDQRKAIFLEEVAYQLFGVAAMASKKITVRNQRMETVEFLKTDIVTSRALAKLDQLFNLGRHQWHDQVKIVFLKGKLWKEEIQQAQKHWNFSYQAHPSLTDLQAKILIIEKITRIA